MLVRAMELWVTFFVVYGAVSHVVDLRQVKVVEQEFPLLRLKEVNTGIRDTLKRRLVVVGACIGTDAHTVGIDAILGSSRLPRRGERLEALLEIEVVNLGAQVLVPDLVARAQAEQADAVLVSQVVTQKDAHLHNVTQMSAAFRKAQPAGCRCSSSAVPASRMTRPSASGSTGSSGGAPPRAGRRPSSAVQTEGRASRPAKKG